MTSLRNASFNEIRNAAARICGDYLNGRWKSVNPDELIVKRISGGLSNFLYYVALPDFKEKNANNHDSSALGIVHDNYDDEVIADEIAGASALNNGIKRRRTDSDESFASFALRRFSHEPVNTNEPQQVLLRIYGQSHGEDALEGMITESVVFALLSERNFGPKLHGIFPGGRIEQFIPARALSTSELSEERISKKIAEKMAEIHTLNIPMSKEPDWIWNCMDRWLASVNSILKNERSHRRREHAKLVHNFDFAAEGLWLKAEIENGNFPVFFCHNDMQEGNILYVEQEKPERSIKLRDSILSLTTAQDTVLEDSGSAFDEDPPSKMSIIVSSGSSNYESDVHDNTRDSALSVTSNSFTTAYEECVQDKEPNLMIIDFEYCAYNYRGFDIANHFLEWTFDYTNPEAPFYYHFRQQYPTEQQQRLFIRIYLKKLKNTIPDYEPSDEEITSILNEVRIFSMLSHLFWSLWSIVNLTSNIEFGYWEYAVSRLKEYRRLKKSFLNGKTKSLVAKSEDTVAIMAE